MGSDFFTTPRFPEVESHCRIRDLDSRVILVCLYRPFTPNTDSLIVLDSSLPHSLTQVMHTSFSYLWAVWWQQIISSFSTSNQMNNVCMEIFPHPFHPFRQNCLWMNFMTGQFFFVTLEQYTNVYGQNLRLREIVFIWERAKITRGWNNSV